MNKSVFKKIDDTTILHGFQEACSDKEFKNFVYGLKIDEKILMKYTSNLQDAFLECKNCANCKSLSACKNKVSGFKYTPRLDKNVIVFSYEACDMMNKNLQENAYKDNLELFELSEDLKNASLKDVYKDDKLRLPIIKYFKKFVDDYNNGLKPKGMYLYGSFGSGKTFLISALFNEMAKKNVRCIMIHYPDLLGILKSSFQTDYSDKIDSIKKTPLLLLDDIGAENVSAWSRDEVLGPILQYRMDNHLPTFFTSNLTLEELEDNLSVTSSGVDKVKAGRIMDRVKQLTEYYELISKNRRVF